MQTTNDTLSADINSVREGVCLSLYQPTHRHHPGNQQDPIRFKNLVKQLESSLRTTVPADETARLLAPFEALVNDTEFWNHTQEGLAILAAPGLFRVVHLQRPVAELAVVASSLHVKPLRRLLRTVDRYQVLGLSLGGIRLFEGNRDVLSPVDGVIALPGNFNAALSDKLVKPDVTIALQGPGNDVAVRTGGGETLLADLYADAETWFRAVDRAVTDQFSKPSGLPLILAALPEHHALFRQVSHNPALMTEGIAVSAETVSLPELQRLAWGVVQPQLEARLTALSDQFGAARAKDHGSDDLAAVAVAAVAGRVTTLLVEADRQIPGRLDATTGRVEAADLAHPEVDDLLDDLCELVAQRGGEVLVVSADRMPSTTGLAAIYRY